MWPLALPLRPLAQAPLTGARGNSHTPAPRPLGGSLQTPVPDR